MEPVEILAYLTSILLPIAAIYLIFVLDLFHTGKQVTVITCIFWGLAGAFGLSYLINTWMQIALDLDFRFISTRTAPILEELLKALILVYFIRQPRFRYFVDGAIYGYAAGIGFAMTENVFYVATDPTGSSAILSLAINRGLSASLMHATASAIVGISFGLSRRSSGLRRYVEPALGVVFAVSLHLVYNNLLFALASGSSGVLLVGGLGIGLGGAVLIAYFIARGLRAEKDRFAGSLSIGEGISSAERKAVQGLGSESIEHILEEMAIMFGAERADLIRQMLVIQANIGILRNNLKNPAGERLQNAWQSEIDELSQEMDKIRQELGSYVMTLLRSLLPEDEDAVWAQFSDSVAKFDPSQVYSFDLFIIASDLAGTMTAEQIEDISLRLNNISIFQHVDLTDLDSLSRAITFRSYHDGEMLFDQGDSGDFMYLIERGYIDIFLIDEQEEETLLRTYQTGEVVGELALLDDQPRSARARANGHLNVMILQRQHFMMFIQNRPNVILAILQFLADRVRYNTKSIIGDAENIVVEHLEEKELTLYDSPFVMDSLFDGDNLKGVFGRLANALADLEKSSTDQEESIKGDSRE